jgi:hypothetical protein
MWVRIRPTSKVGAVCAAAGLATVAIAAAIQVDDFTGNSSGEPGRH